MTACERYPSFFEIHAHWSATLRALVFAVAGCATTISASAEDIADLQSGVYALRTVVDSQQDFRELYIAVDGNRVSAYFNNPYTQPAINVPDLDPTCRFFLDGILKQSASLVLRAWYPNREDGKIRRAGSLKLSKSDLGWAVTIDDPFPNCAIATVDDGDTLFLQATRPDWRRFAYVKSARARLYTSPSIMSKSPAYLVQYNPIALLRNSADPGWVQADYFNGRTGSLKRWLKEADVSARPE